MPRLFQVLVVFQLGSFELFERDAKGTIRHLKRKMSHRFEGQSHELTGTKNKTKQSKK